MSSTRSATMSSLQQSAVAKRPEPQTFPQFLQAYQAEISRALPKHLSADRMARIALTEYRKSTNLQKCEPTSIFASVIMLSQLGLEPGVLGQAYLVPYGNQCQAIPGWKGLVDLVSRTGRATVSTQAVYAGDEFEYEFGTKPFLRHKPSGREPANRADFTHVYAVGRVRGAEEPIFEVWTHERVTKHRDRFNKVGKQHYSFQHFEMYARKVVLLQVLKYLPASPELQTAMELEIAAEKDGQKLDLSNVIDGSWSEPSAASASEEKPESGAGVDQSTGEFEPAYTVQSAIKALREATTLKGLSQLWADIVADFQETGRDLSIDIEAARNERRDVLQQQK